MPAKTPGPTTATRSNAQITELIDLLETMQNKAKGLKNFLIQYYSFLELFQELLKYKKLKMQTIDLRV